MIFIMIDYLITDGVNEGPTHVLNHDGHTQSQLRRRCNYRRDRGWPRRFERRAWTWSTTIVPSFTYAFINISQLKTDNSLKYFRLKERCLLCDRFTWRNIWLRNQFCFILIIKKKYVLYQDSNRGPFDYCNAVVPISYSESKRKFMA